MEASTEEQHPGFASTAQPCETDSLELVWEMRGCPLSSAGLIAVKVLASSCFGLRPRPSISPHTQRDERTDRQADCQLIFCFSSRLFTLRVTVAAASSRGPRAAKFWQTLPKKNSKVLLASLRAASHPDKGDRGAGLGQSGAPRTHSATELP